MPTTQTTIRIHTTLSGARWFSLNGRDWYASPEAAQHAAAGNQAQVQA